MVGMRGHNGFTLLELVLVIVLLAVGLTGALLAFTQGTQDSSYSQNMAIATTLAQDLMEEIRSKCWDEAATPPPCNGVVVLGSAIGPDGETRGTYDDVDDLNNLDNTPPQNSQGAAMPAAYNIFRQRASVCYVAQADLTTCIAGPSNYKRVIVTMSWGAAGDDVQLTSLMTNH